MEKSVLVIGDVMLDKHTSGEVERISPEAPVPVIKADQETRVSLGAAGNVAAQFVNAGHKTYLAHKHFTPSATDPRLQSGWISLRDVHEVFDMMFEAGIEPFPLFYTGKNGPVTVKERIWTGQQQICRVDYEDPCRPTPEMESLWIKQIMDLIEDKDIECVVFSDYDKGTLTDRIIQTIADFVWDNDGITVLDPKRHSYWGLQHLTVIKPNRREIEITHLDPQKISEELGDTYLLNTLSEDGMKLWHQGAQVHSQRTYSKASDIVDVCGCGDTTTAFIALALMRDKSIQEAMKIASLAASINIEHVGCHVLDENEVECVFSSTYEILRGSH